MINELYDIQSELNKRIMTEHNLVESDIIDDRYLALMVELGELANETRTFKYWSNKGMSEKTILLEEFSDGLHFILSIGLQLGRPNLHLLYHPSDRSMTELFLSLYNDTLLVRDEESPFVFLRLFQNFMEIGRQLGFSEEEVVNHYMLKNEINHQRQDNNY